MKAIVMMLLAMWAGGVWPLAITEGGGKMREREQGESNKSEGYITTDDGVRLFYQKVGEGPKTIIIPNALFLFDDFKKLASDRYTLIFYDLRNRGRSDAVTDHEKLKSGVRLDVEDLEAVRRHFQVEKAALIGHSYLGFMVALYAMKYPDRVERVIQIGPVQPQAGKEYPAHLRSTDATLADVSAKLAELAKEAGALEGKEYCRQWWSVVRVIYVANPADAAKLSGSGCEFPNEWPVNLMKHFGENIFPSIQAINLTPADAARVAMPVLTIHGMADRNAPYGGGREWAFILPDARLVTIKGGAHLPWIEAPEEVFASIRRFLDGQWPEAAEKVRRVDPKSESPQ